jgi:hypothetical protein
MQAAIAAAALVVAWRRQRELELPLVLGLALVLEFGWIALHLAHGVDADSDSARALPREGNAFLHGAYPESEYPPGAILLFALDVLLGGGSTRVAHAFLMISFQIAVVAGIWSFRTRWSAWLATVAALWPLNAFFWEYQPTVTCFTSGRRITQFVLVVPGAGTTLSGFRPPTGSSPSEAERCSTSTLSTSTGRGPTTSRSRPCSRRVAAGASR